ncbi:hypothetical protein BIW11_03863 [Tropilaelaps mercedesae]|uniref:Uncharacterized protein n=1 Tax=Tropilaelaps mercedesae TaxID=418985 RepID=A0A1V9XEN4_9ACAR|nr:hypothetical protein BIW11_03863 [Tropilaelaps mercedesae]
MKTGPAAAPITLELSSGQYFEWWRQSTIPSGYPILFIMFFSMGVCAVLMSVLELAFFVDFWLAVRDRSEAWRWWRCVRCLDFIPKAGLYATLAILCFVYQHGDDIWLPVLAGVISIVLAVMYLIVGLLIYTRIKREQDFPAFEVDLSFPEPASLIQQEEIILL